MSFVKVYDQHMRLQTVLENATDVQYQQVHNELSTGAFSLPLLDPKMAYCQAHSFVEIEDPPRAPMMYRIIAEPQGSLTNGKLRTFTLEGAEATMLDKLIFGYHQIGGTGVDTEAVLRWLLDRQDEPKRWVLGRCDFHYEFEYKFESVHLLAALFSVAECIADEYTWIFDTNVTPWTVSLVRSSTTPSCGLHYMRNMTDIQKSMDACGLVTRLYPVGYGEGVNELHIGAANDGVDYIDADTISIWGVKEAVYPDKRIEDAETLLARGRAVLEELKNPYISYTATAADLSRYTQQRWDMFMAGDLIRVLDHEHGDLRMDMRLKSVQKGDLYGAPHGVTMTIANSERDVTGTINALADRAGIMELYSQGATNMTADQFADNADPDNPFEFPLYLDSDMRRINKVLLRISIEAFRSYEKGAADGGGSSCTSANGGSGSVTSGGGGSGTVSTTEKGVTASFTGNTGYATNADGTLSNTGSSDGKTEYATASHKHQVNSHTHLVEAVGERTGSAAPLTGESDDTEHRHGIGAHTHYMSHWHSYDHSHTVKIPELTVTLPSHTHAVTLNEHSHNVTFPNHTHDMIHGIYRGSSASAYTLYVDGKEVPQEAIVNGEVDIVPYLSCDEEGRIQRETWHAITLTPDKLTRVVMRRFVKTFIQSVGGGDY